MDYADSYITIARAYAAGWRRPPRRSVSGWADARRRLPSKGASEPGRWRTARVPFVREIMDALSPHDPTRRVVFMKSTQVAGTEAGLNWTGSTIEDSPAPMMIVQPTIDIAERFSKQRVAAMIDATPELRARVAPARSRDSGNTTLLKEFAGGILVIAGANSAAGLRSMPIKNLMLDEVDAYPVDLDGEGDPVELAERRTSTFPRRKVLLVSTPTIKGASRIDDEWQASDQRHYHVPCPHCGHFQRLVWGQLSWPEGHPEQAAYACRQCGVLIEEHRKTAMLAAGVWIAEHPGRPVRGYHINALYTPIGLGDTWGDHAARFIAVKGDPAKFKTWINTTLGEPWEDRSRSLHGDALAARAEPVPLRTVLAGYLILTLGVDVQPDRLSCSLWAWGRGERGWLVDRMVLPGDPNHPDVWDRLDTLRHTPVRNGAGIDLRIAMTAIDTGGSNTHAVYAYVRARRHDRVIGIKGASQAGKPVLGRPSKVDVNWKGQVLKQGAEVWLVGTDTAKHALIARLVGDAEQTDPEQRLLRWPTGLPDDFFAELSAEVFDPRLKRWTLIKGRRNEGLDELVYAFAAAQHPFVRIGALREHDWAKLQALLEPASGDLFTAAPAAPAADAAREAPAAPPDEPAPQTKRGPTAARIW